MNQQTYNNIYTIQEQLDDVVSCVNYHNQRIDAIERSVSEMSGLEIAMREERDLHQRLLDEINTLKNMIARMAQTQNDLLVHVKNQERKPTTNCFNSPACNQRQTTFNPPVVPAQDNTQSPKQPVYEATIPRVVPTQMPLLPTVHLPLSIPKLRSEPVLKLPAVLKTTSGPSPIIPRPNVDFPVIEDRDTREDITDLPIIAVDNESTRIRDDAIHIREIDGGEKFEVGVHCTDYPISVDPCNREEFMDAFNHCEDPSRFYVVCEDKRNRYSLRVGGDMPAFSLVVTFSSATKKVVDVKYFKSIIRVKALLTFSEFDSVVNNGQANINESNFDGIDKGTLFQNVKCLQSFAAAYFTAGPSSAFDIIRCIVREISTHLADELFRVYGDKAFVKPSKNGSMWMSFRSPLRKFFDMCTLKQLEVMQIDKSTEDMMKLVAGDESLFNEIITKFKSETAPALVPAIETAQLDTPVQTTTSDTPAHLNDLTGI